MVSIKNVSKRFASKTVVNDMSLEIGRGEFVGLLGPNGAGKTTTINMIIGELTPDSGSIILGDSGSPQQSAVRRTIGIVPQTLALYDNLPAYDNLDFFAQLYGIRGSDRSRHIQRALEVVNLTERKRDYVKTFSGGMKRRLNIAIALLHQPALLVLDEPTVGVDPQSRNAIFDCLRKMKAEGCTILLTSHYLEEAQHLCDSVAIMDEGKILARGTVNDVIENYGGLATLTMETSNGVIQIETSNPVQEIIRVHQEAQIISLRMNSPSLEKAFLNITGKHLRD